MKKRVRIPMRNPKALLDLAKKVREKHLADGEESPLKILNWAEINQLIDDAINAEEMALKLKREKLSMFQLRTSRMDAVAEMLRSSRNILAGVHSKRMKQLGLWGFDVLDGKVTLPEEVEPTAPAVTA